MRKRLTKKILSMLTAFLLCVSMLTVSVYADTEALTDIPAAQAEEQEIDAADETAPAQDEASVTEEAEAEPGAAAEEDAEAAGEDKAAADGTDLAADDAVTAGDEAEAEVEVAAGKDDAAAAEENADEAEAEAAPEEAAAAETVKTEEEKEIKKAEAGETEIAFSDCKIIGYDEYDDPCMYYINIGDASTTIKLTDLPDELEYAMITNFVGSTFGDGTNIVDLSDGYGITYEWLRSDGEEAYGQYIDESLIEGLDLSNLYGLFVMDEEDGVYYILVQGVHVDPISAGFTLDKGTITSYTKDGHTFSDWLPPTWEYASLTVDLYTVEVPFGTTAVNLGFEDELLAYAYGPGRSYIASCGEYLDGSVGQKTAIVKAQEDGTFPQYVYVQTPYNTSGDSTTLYAIEFITTYTFSASYNGKALTNIKFEADNYTCNDMYGVAPTCGTYTITIPNEATKIDFVLSDPVLHYNYDYKAGTYLGGMVEDYMNGDTVFSSEIDCNKDGVLDCIQIQTPYDAAWNTTLHYVILFEFVDPTVDPGQTTDDIPEDVMDIYKNVGDAQDEVLNDNAIYSAEWIAMELSRAGYETPAEYYEDVVNTVESKNGKLDTNQYDYTNYAKVILAMTAGGKDPRFVAGYDLTEALADYDAILNQGINGAMWALLAADSAAYEIPKAAEGKTQSTREKLIDAILAAQLEDGGWAYGFIENEPSDPDLTAMAIQSLAPYYQVYADVKAAVDKALDLLASMETEDGTFKSEDAAGAPTSESTAQVIIALTALGINPATDARFVKNGKSPIDGLCSFWTDGGFKHTANGTWNAIATYQGYEALVSYYRLLDGQTSLYDMTDVDLSVIPIELKEENVTLAYTTTDFTGKQKRPGTTVTATVKGAEATLVKGTDYTVTFKNNLHNGTAKAVIEGKGNYSGTIEKTFTINRVDITKANLEKAIMFYTGEALTQNVTVYAMLDGQQVELKNGTHYTVKYENNTDVGMATVTITGKANYKGTITKTFQIRPNVVKITNVFSPSTGWAKVEWEKAEGNVDGYQIWFSEDTSFAEFDHSEAAGTAVKKVRTTLTPGKTYYVKVRAFKDTETRRIYGSWSELKTVTTKK